MFTVPALGKQGDCELEASLGQEVASKEENALLQNWNKDINSK